jgi:hypothetical protein
MEPYGIGIGLAVVFAILFAVAGAVVVAAIAHVFIRRYWVACAVVTALVLLGCGAWHTFDTLTTDTTTVRHTDAGETYYVNADTPTINDTPSIVMFYGIGGASGLAVAALAGLPVRLIRDARERSSARRLADRWDARERRAH